jgi:hypothetical protein
MAGKTSLGTNHGDSIGKRPLLIPGKYLVASGKSFKTGTNLDKPDFGIGIG